MSCINEEQIQQYLDNESPRPEREAIRQHLEVCISCREALKQQHQRVLEVKQSLDLLVTQQPQIPPFRAPAKTRAQKNIAVKFLWPLAVAAGLLLLLMLRPFSDSKNMPINGQNLQFVISDEFDANKPLSEHPLIMTVVAPDGTVTQTSIN